MDTPEANTVFACQDQDFQEIAAGQAMRCTVTPKTLRGRVWARTDVWQFTSEDGTGEGDVGSFAEVTSRDLIATDEFTVIYTAPNQLGKQVTLKAGIGNVCT